MQLRKVFLTFIPLLLLIAAPVASTLAQEPATPTATSTAVAASPDVAILVVDVFEEPVESEPVSLEELSQTNPDGSKAECAISLDGQDGAAIRGGSAVTSSMHPYSLPHGRLVYKHFQKILDDRYNGGADSSTEPTPMEQNWSTPIGNIWLRAVDTQDYNINLIADKVEAAVADLVANEVEYFVINMSFAIVPCEQIPQVSLQDYQQIILDMGIPCVDTPGITGFTKIACELESITTTEDNYDQVLIAIRDSGIPEDVSAYAILQMEVMRPKVLAALNASIPEPPEAEDEAFTIFTDRFPSTVKVVQVAAAGNNGRVYPYYPALNKNVLAVSADYYVPTCPTGTQADVVDYLMSNDGITDITTAYNIAAEIVFPRSNKGEVQANGYTSLSPQDYFIPPVTGADVIGCLFGSSFAAPQVSLQMAIDQLSGNGAVCLDAAGVQILSEPPLAHNRWDNLDLYNAAIIYCPDFPRN